MEHSTGVDLHKAFFQACAVDAVGMRCWEDRFATTPAAWPPFWRGRPRTSVGVEASGPTWSFVDQLQGRFESSLKAAVDVAILRHDGDVVLCGMIPDSNVVNSLDQDERRFSPILNWPPLARP